jgi:tetratricopeptide (TPR) repeat protein
VTEPIYERYKDALRRGHVAALRGQLTEALAAYAEAGEIAPDRALPHSSRGAVLARLGRSDDALIAFEAALERSTRDEAALAGRADALVALRRRMEAAETLDRLAEVHEQAGRPAEACDTARRALELAESRTRRQLVDRLAASLVATPADERAVAAIADSMGVLETEAIVRAHSAPPPVPAPAAEAAAAEPEPTATAEPDSVASSEPVDRGDELTAEAEALVLTGDRSAARDRCLAAAASHRAAGRSDAAIDACYLGLSLVPGDLSLHLELAELYLARGWREPAAEKLLLLGRLVDLDADANAHERLCAIVNARFADDPRLAALCP